MKLLIIDDHYQMINLVQKQFAYINNHFTSKNTFFFKNEGDNLIIKPVTELDEGYCVFQGFTADYVTEKIDSFIKECVNSELLFIVIDMCLKHNVVGNVDVDDYYANEEICAQLYKHLIELKNHSNNDKGLAFFICSRAETSVSVISQILKDLYHKEKAQAKHDESKFPYPSCEINNISWFLNRWSAEAEDNNTIADNYPLSFTKKIISYIKGLKDKE